MVGGHSGSVLATRTTPFKLRCALTSQREHGPGGTTRVPAAGEASALPGEDGGGVRRRFPAPPGRLPGRPPSRSRGPAGLSIPRGPKSQRPSESRRPPGPGLRTRTRGPGADSDQHHNQSVVLTGMVQAGRGSCDGATVQQTAGFACHPVWSAVDGLVSSYKHE